MNCRHCKTSLQHTFLDLGFAPPSNAYLTRDSLCQPELYFPLKVNVCHNCWLVQTEDYTDARELFTSDYAYFSSTSTGWLEHAKNYVDKIIKELGLSTQSRVVEVACNDGYLLKNFLNAGISCLGIEPTESTANVAEELGIPVIKEFFGEILGAQLESEGKGADLIIGNNVYAHVPDINDFTRGLKRALNKGGTITLEFPHLMRLIENVQFDTIYHEHFSYLSLHTVNTIFSTVGLRIWKVEELTTHGGSLRIYACHHFDSKENEPSVDLILNEEKKQGLLQLETYLNFQARADKIKDSLLAFLLEQKKHGKTVFAYGAAAKGNTLLNYAGVRPDLIPVVFDAAKSKQGKYMPGSHIPILPSESLADLLPDCLLILPWNIADEIKNENNALAEKGTKFVTAVPKLAFL
jgi:SAM-dependent methyltransferase